MQRAYNDDTDIPASQAFQAYSPRVRVNALLNTAVTTGETVTWRGKRADAESAVLQLEAELIVSMGSSLESSPTAP